MLPTSFKSIGLSVQFDDDRHSGHLGFLIGSILAIFDVQVIPMLPTEFQVNWPFGSGKATKNRFSRWPPLQHLGFLIGMILALFDLQVSQTLPTKFQVSHSGQEKNEQELRQAGHYTPVASNGM